MRAAAYDPETLREFPHAGRDGAAESVVGCYYFGSWEALGHGQCYAKE